MQLDEKIKRFTEAVNKEAVEQVESIENRISVQREEALRKAEDEVLLECYKYIKNEVSKYKIESSRIVSDERIKEKSKFFKRRSEIIDEVFDALKFKIENFKNTDGYKKYLNDSLKKAIEILSGEELKVYANDFDLALFDKNINAKFLHRNFDLGGFELECKSKNKILDCTLDSKFNELKSTFVNHFSDKGGNLHE